MVCKTCNHKMDDLTHGKGRHRNFYCRHCHSHWWKGIFYTSKEWNNWINEGF